MNALELHKPDGTATGWTMCFSCGQIACPGDRDLSEKCCACYRCGLPLTEIDKRCHSLYHVSCDRLWMQEQETAKLAKAEEVFDYEGPVFLDHVGSGSYGEGFFADAQELSEHLDFHEGVRPEFAYACEAEHFRGIDAGYIYENAAADMFDDATDHFCGTEEFEEACRVFNNANKNVISWHADFTRKVRIPVTECAKQG